MVRQSFEDTWEELTRHAAELAGHRVRLTVLEDAAKGESAAHPEKTLAQALEGYVGKFASGTPHNDAANVENIWGDYVVEKHRKRQERRT